MKLYRRSSSMVLFLVQTNKMTLNIHFYIVFNHYPLLWINLFFFFGNLKFCLTFVWMQSGMMDVEFLRINLCDRKSIRFYDFSTVQKFFLLKKRNIFFWIQFRGHGCQIWTESNLCCIGNHFYSVFLLFFWGIMYISFWLPMSGSKWIFI